MLLRCIDCFLGAFGYTKSFNMLYCIRRLTLSLVVQCRVYRLRKEETISDFSIGVNNSNCEMKIYLPAVSNDT